MIFFLRYAAGPKTAVLSDGGCLGLGNTRRARMELRTEVGWLSLPGVQRRQHSGTPIQITQDADRLLSRGRRCSPPSGTSKLRAGWRAGYFSERRAVIRPPADADLARTGRNQETGSGASGGAVR